MKRIGIIGLGLGLLFAMGASIRPVLGQSFRTGDNVRVSSQEKIDSSLYTAGQTVDIAADVKGDVFCVGQSISISGDVSGDVICAGQSVTITGNVKGDIRVAGQTVVVSGRVGNNLSAAGQTITLSSDAEVGQDAGTAGQTVNLNGDIARDVAAASENLNLGGMVGRNVVATVNTLHIAEESRVTGDVEYTSNTEADIADGAVVKGEVIRNTPAQGSGSNFGELARFGVGFFFYSYFAALLIAAVLTLLLPRVIHETTTLAVKSPLKVAATGVVALFSAPVLIVIVMISIIGLPLGMVLALMWLMVLILSGPFSGYYLGRLLMPNSQNIVLTTLAGAGLLYLSFIVPVLGFIAFLATLIMGSGMILQQIMRRTAKPNYKVKV